MFRGPQLCFRASGNRIQVGPQCQYPKLLLVGNPGALVSPEFAEKFASTLHDCVRCEITLWKALPAGGSPRADRLCGHSLDQGAPATRHAAERGIAKFEPGAVSRSVLGKQ